MYFCKALFWKSLWIKASAKGIHVNVSVAGIPFNEWMLHFLSRCVSPPSSFMLVASVLIRVKFTMSLNRPQSTKRFRTTLRGGLRKDMAGNDHVNACLVPGCQSEEKPRGRQ